MPTPDVPLAKLGFLTIGTFDGADPGPGIEALLAQIELGERLGFDSAWLRHRHLQYGVSSPVAIMAALSQRTSRIELGTAVTPLAWENPLRLAEDLATVDVLARGRINPGISVGPPMRWDDIKDALYPDTADVEDFSYERVVRFLSMIGGESVATAGTQGSEVFSDRIQPHAPGLRERVWYGAGSVRSATWAAGQRLNLLTSSVVTGATSADFAGIQAELIATYREAHPAGRVSQGLVVIPTDTATAQQRVKYEAYVASRLPRTAEPQGPRGLLFAPDLVGTSTQIAERLYAHPGFRQVSEVAFALPFSFDHEDYVQILTDVAGSLGPALGWAPATTAAATVGHRPGPPGASG